MLVTRRGLTYARVAPVAFAGAVAAGVAAVAARVLALVALAVALQRGLLDRDSAAVSGWLVVAGASVAAELGFRVVGARAAARVSTAVLSQVRGRLVTAVVDLGPGWLRGQRAGRVQATVGDGVEALQGYVAAYLPQVAVATIAPPILVLAALALDVRAGAAAALAAVLLPLSKPLWARVVGDRSRAHWQAYAVLSARMQEMLSGMTTLRLLDAVEDRRSEIARDAVRLERENRSGLQLSLVAYCLATLTVGLGTVAVSLLAAEGLLAGRLDPLVALILVLCVGEVFRPMVELESLWGAGFRGRAAAEAIDEIVVAPRPLVGGDQPADHHGAGRPASTPVDGTAGCRVRFAAVTFRYPGADHAAVDGVELELAPGETVALVGRSGAGKSTLVHLLQRWYDPERGQVLVDGFDIASLPLAAHRQRVAVVAQDVRLVGSTLRDHLRLARPDADDDVLLEALARARALDLVAGLPDGLDTPVGEHGARLSGGERQRVALATAFLSDAPMLVLDEATSALDGRTEAAVMAAVAEVSRGRTTLLIAHRLASAARADRIAVLEAGRVAEVGTPRELAQSGGRLADLVAAQLVRT